MELTVVGKPVPRVDAREKITGEAIYGYDLVLPNMLYGKVLFSTGPMPDIKKINTEKAKAYPGVAAVVTGEDVPGHTASRSRTSRSRPGQSALHRGTGGRSRRGGRRHRSGSSAADRSRIRRPPRLHGPEEACKPGCVAIHEDFAKSAKPNSLSLGPMPNVAEHFKLRTGDVSVGFQQSDVVLEERYFVPMIQHAAMEPHSAHAQFERKAAGSQSGLPTTPRSAPSTRSAKA